MFLCLLPAGAVRSQIIMSVKLYFTTFRWHVILQVLKFVNKMLKFGLLFTHMQRKLSKCSIK